jgi:hypothetical protein
VAFSQQVTSTTTPTTTVPGSIITIKGGPFATANLPGERQDASDFYGIVIVLLAIVVVIIAARSLFGRKRRRRPGSPGS